MIITNLINRYRALPDLSFRDKVWFAAYRSLYKKLIERQIIDVDGSLNSPRFVKEGTPQSGDTYQKLICITGFGWSGSGAVVDLLSEYDNVSNCLSCEQAEYPSETCPEFDLLRNAGGLFDFERAFQDENVYVRDAAVRLFLVLVRSIYLRTVGFFNEDCLMATHNFLERIVDFVAPSESGYGFCGAFSPLGHGAEKLILGDSFLEQGIGSCFFLKNLSVAQFRVEARKYIEEVLRSIPSKEFLILDQGLSDFSMDIGKYVDYLGDFKLIAVYRDPRDMYATRLKDHTARMLPIDPENFIKWYRQSAGKILTVRDRHFLCVRFEDLICDYSPTVKRIETFLGISAFSHKWPKRYLKPDVSRRNIGIFREFCDLPEMRVVSEALKEYYYRG